MAMPLPSSAAAAGRETGLGEFLMELRPLVEQSPSAPQEATREVVVRLPHGIHARPAAQISTAARGFASEIELSARARRVNAKSIAALMSLGVRKDEAVVIAARGADAQAAVAALADLIERGIEEALEAPVPPAPTVTPPASDLPANVLRGVCGAPGLVIGKALQLRATEFAVSEDAEDSAREAAALATALAAVRARLDRLAAAGNRQRREILGAHLALLGRSRTAPPSPRRRRRWKKRCLRLAPGPSAAMPMPSAPSTMRACASGSAISSIWNARSWPR